jgi:hypothetical protein
MVRIDFSHNQLASGKAQRFGHDPRREIREWLWRHHIIGVDIYMDLAKYTRRMTPLLKPKTGAGLPTLHHR